MTHFMMTTNLRIAILIFMMTQGVLFGIGAVTILSMPYLSERAWELFPWMVAASFVIAAPIAWLIAPMLRARYEMRSRAPSI
ncbi:hypothetical protein [Phreatobacter aquaticus]|nr:hypothetical protein [Phreatobacter aquaticus]